MHMLEGLGGNITVAVAKDGIIMVDSEYAPLHDKIKAAIADDLEAADQISDRHALPRRSHRRERAVRQGRRDRRRPGQRQKTPGGGNHQRPDRRQDAARAEAALPSDTYTNFSKIRLSGRVADLKHIANAHTDGDTYVWFKTANVLSTGDTFTNGRYPNIDFANGGNINGMIAATDAYLKLTNAKSRIVPGHGPLADRAALVAYRMMLVTARERMAALVKEGKSEDEVIAAKPFADLDVKWAPTELAGRRISCAWSITRLRTSRHRSRC